MLWGTDNLQVHMMSLPHAVGLQLRNPQGFWGAVTGYVMAIVNARPNNLAVGALCVKPRDIVLEMGFGSGKAVALMASRITGGELYGIDGSAAMLVQAMRRNKKAVQQGRVHLRTGDFSMLPFENGMFDKILAVNVAYFWKDDAAVLQECRRVLRPGGRISIYATDADTMKRWKFADTKTHRHYTASLLIKSLQQSGFKNCNVDKETISRWPKIKGLIATAHK